jgi:hypothetical protein
LLKEARAIATASATPVGDFDHAVKAARRSVVPAGKIDKRNPFVRLVRLGQRFVASQALARHELSAELLALVHQCEALMAPPPRELETAGGGAARLPYRDE